MSPLFIDDRKVFTAKVKANIANAQLCGEFSATVIEVISGKRNLAIKDSPELKF